MNKKILIIVCIVLFLVAIINIYTWQKSIFSKSTFAINMNWNIPFSLPINDKNVYSKHWPESGPDGYYYYIARYDSKEKIEKMNRINWSKLIDDNYQKLVDTFYQKLKIDGKYKVNLNDSLLYYTKNDKDDYLILVYNNKNHYLYIFEKTL